MSLTAGTRLGPYEIVSAIGAGGMGEVYRATDSNLKRSVAIKVLPAAVAGDGDRLARFQREAEVLAALNHPNIAAIYGLEKTADVTALVMELVEGDDLSALINRGYPEAESGSSRLRDTDARQARESHQPSAPGVGPRRHEGSRAPRGLSIEDALPIARQIADALEAAHEQGIIHRDLKPANIKVRPDGTVKVLDFGLAKAMGAPGPEDPGLQGSTDAANSPTLTARATQMGMILGTAAYMAPEQAKGRSVDKRADIWAFGVVLFEMLTGQRAFKGDDVSETLASVLKDVPDFAALPASTPPRLRALIERCLERDIKLRLRDIGEARILLSNPLEPAASLATSRASASSRWPWVVAAASAFAAATLAVGTFAGWWSLAREVAPQVVHLDVDFGGSLTVQDTVGISPDGQRVAFIGADENGKRHLAIRPLNETTVTRLRPIEGEITDVAPPFFSPDSQWIGYVSEGQLMKIAVAGGPATRIAGGIVTNSGQGRWGAEEILVPAFAGMIRVSIKDGTSTATPYQVAAFLQDGRTILTSGLYSARAIATVAPGDATPRPVTKLEGKFARYVPTGYLVYIDENDVLQAIAFDVNRMETSGDPLPLMERVSWFDVSDTGTLIFTRTAIDPGRTIDWFDETGRRETIVKAPGTYGSPRLSPDGAHLAFGVADRAKRSVSIHHLDRGIARPLAPAEATVSDPLWMPGGRHILYRGPAGIWIARTDGSGAPRRLIEISGVPDAISPDGRSLAVTINGASTKRDIVRVPLSGEPDALQAGTPEPLLAGPADEINPVYSPDGKWLAYSSDQSGEFQVYVLAVGDAQSRWQVSSVQGLQAFLPRWAPQSRQLFFKGIARQGLLASTPLFVASYSVAGNAFVPGAVKPFGGSVVLSPLGASPIYDVAPGGRRVVGLLLEPRAAPAPSRPTFGVMLNAFSEIQTRADGPGLSRR